ncbi:hypothetical protein I350_06292 [Cryptococcus amylolentus CBS 6273]|uniref:BUB protein kinase n=1 Tax=Cryptococcus amylolentus CBS 6273 TaxID=1296118 RepID=A0A1E3JNG8_9TREE|nr:hypothetical protein I350_06292 [Cryptococcus amylolentus CBS 6273]
MASPPRSPTGAPTTDFALIEAQKENIRPLATGRSAATLSAVLKEPSAAEKVVQEGHDKHRQAIEEAEKKDKAVQDQDDDLALLGDILDVYNKYILFTVQHHPSSDFHLLPLLETTTRRFVNDPRYQMDPRYLRLWVMYARHIERREEIWAFLESRNIGTDFSLFYEEWATALEGLGRRKKADEVYRIGIARKANPVERLKTRHKQFLERIMAPPSGVVPDDDPVPASSARTPSRAVLGQVRSGPSSSVAGATQLAPSMRTSSVNNGRKMEIFADAEGNKDETSAPEWADFGTRDERRKENTAEAGPWQGETLPQSANRGRVAPRTPKVAVFQDSTEQESARVQGASEVFSRHRQPPTEAELLKSDPLRHYDTSSLSTDLPSLPAPPSARKPPRLTKVAAPAAGAAPAPAKAAQAKYVMQPWTCPSDGPLVKMANGKQERRMFDWDMVYKDGDEYNFEQIRAKQRGLYGREGRGEVQAWEREMHKPGSTSPPKPKPVESRKPPSPTVNTKLAEAEVMSMFDQTIHGGKMNRDSDSESESESESEEDGGVQIAPTPLPNRTGNVQMLAPTPGGFVPPTPTPSAPSRLFSAPSSLPTISDENGKPSKPVVFSDENNVPPPSAKKFNIFSDDASAPPPSASKPRAFGIFSDENQTPARPTAASQETPRQPLAASNIFSATPAVAPRNHGLGRVTEAIVEEEEEEQIALPPQTEDAVEDVVEGVASASLDEPPAEPHYYDKEEDQQPRGMRRFNINMMTPITERTCEYTQFIGASGVGRESLARRLEEEEEDEENEETGDKGNSGAPSEFDESGLASGDVRDGFQLPDGFTIHQAEERSDIHTMVLVDGKDEGTATTLQDKSVYHTANGDQIGASELADPCDPTAESTVTALLNAIDPPLSELPGLVDNRSTAINKLDALEKHARSKLRRASTSSRTSTSGDDHCTLTLAGDDFEVHDKLGQGGFGIVFLGVDIALRRAQDDADSDDEEDEPVDRSQVAIKVEKPGMIWEAVVLDRIHSRLDKALRQSIIQPRNLYLFQDESYLILDYCTQGTLLDVVNKSSSIFGNPGQGVDELLAIFFVIELLRLVEGLHSAQFIHGDLKIDNCLVRIADLPNSSWSAAYSRAGSDGWSQQGLRLIDFGRAIDLSLFPRGTEQTFQVSHTVDDKDCTEMRQGKPWSYQTDYFGLAGVAYCMLFGKYMKTIISEGKVKIDQPLKRYWQPQLWQPLFDTLLNPGHSLPITNQLTTIREELEGWLEDNCQKGGKSLKSLLRKIELAATTGKKM